MVNTSNDNTGKRNTPSPSSSGYSCLDYSIVGCAAIILLLIIVLLDAYEYVSVPGASVLRGSGGGLGKAIGSDVVVSAREQGAAMEAMTASATKEDLEEAKREIDEAKATLAKLHAEVAKIVDKAEVELKEEKVVEAAKNGESPIIKTPEEKKKEEVKKEEIVETIVDKELGIDKWCGTCIWNNFVSCDRRKDWLMITYKITEEVAKESCAQWCIKK